MRALRALVAVALALAFTACTVNPDPRHPTLAQMQRGGLGSWILLDTTHGEIRGELIACDGDFVHVRAEPMHRAVGVPKSAIERARLFEYESEGGFGVWGAVGAISTISHGLFLGISAPVWLIVSGVSSSSEASHVILDFPDHEWSDFARWARFPQGMPTGLAVEKLDADFDQKGIAPPLPPKEPPRTLELDREPPPPTKAPFEPSIHAKWWLGAQLETLPLGKLDVSANGTPSRTSTQLAFGAGIFAERRLGDHVIVGVAPRVVTPVGLSGVAGGGSELDLRARVAVGGEVARKLHVHALGTVGYAWIFHATSTTDPMTGATSFATTSGAIGGLGTRIAYTLAPRFLLVSELSYQWSAQGHARVAVPTSIDIGIANQYLTIGVGLAGAVF